jgi:hypothetical protein
MVTSAPSGGSAARPRPRQVQPRQARKLTRPAVGLMAVVVFQLLFASVFLSVLHRPALHHAPVAVADASPIADTVSRQDGGAIRLIREPTAQAARAAIRDGQAYAALVAGRPAESLLIQTAASPGTASALTSGFTQAAAALKAPLVVRDLAPLPASDPPAPRRTSWSWPGSSAGTPERPCLRQCAGRGAPACARRCCGWSC